MEVERRDFRAMIFYDFKRGLKQQESCDLLKAIFGECAPSRATIFNWYAEFKWGRQSLKDEPHPGRPAIIVNEENIAAENKVVKEDRHVTYGEREKHLGIGSAAVQTIIHQHLRLHKRCSLCVQHLLTDSQKEARVDWCRFMIAKFKNGKAKTVFDIVTGDESWIYHYDPETKQQSSVWCYENEAPPKKIRRSRSVGKKMVVSFFSKSGHIATIALEDRKTVSADWYVSICVLKILASLQE